MSTTILSIDLGKFSSVLCWYEPGTHSVEFRTVKTTPSVSVGLEVVHFFGLDPGKPTLVSIGQSAVEGTGVPR